MGYRGSCVVGHETFVEGVIFPRGIGEHPLIEWRALVP
jgi:hypothetical protein